MTEIQPIKLNIPELIRRQANSHEHNVAPVPSFLNLTSQSNNFNMVGIVRKNSSDVYSGDVQDEIDRINQESDTISDIINNNSSVATSTTLASSGKVLSFTNYEPVTNSSDSVVKASGHTVAKKTNTNKLISRLQYSTKYNKADQKEILEGAIEKLVNWLDDMIINYEERVSTGQSRGDSEVKLSFLLRLRKQIENCDFPVGFGNDDYFNQNSSETSLILGAYSNSYNLNTYLNPKDNAQENNAALNHTDRNIILNAKAYIIDRKYKTESELVNAMNNGDFDYIADLVPNSDEYYAAINDFYGSAIMSSKDFYLNYTETYLASVLAHEFIHATHIVDEAVTYNTCELIEDDFRNEVVYDGWSVTTQAAIDRMFSGLNLSSITYGESFIPIGDGLGLGFHDLAAYNGSGSETVVQHGWTENGAYNYYNPDGSIRSYDSFGKGNTVTDCYNELLNFVV